MKQNRIFIVGSPGSGKTTLAKALSRKLQIPHFDLDNIRFMPNGTRRPDGEAIPLVESLTQHKSGLIEGIYISWISHLTHKANLIVWLDTPFYKALYRILLRYLKNLRQNQYGFKSTIILLKNLILFHLLRDPNNSYITRKQTHNLISNHKGEVLHIKNNHDLQRLFDKP